MAPRAHARPRYATTRVADGGPARQRTAGRSERSGGESEALEAGARSRRPRSTSSSTSRRWAPDGYHPLASLMSFADVGDRLTLQSGRREQSSKLDRPLRRRPRGRRPRRQPRLACGRAPAGAAPACGRDPFRLTLEKLLPVAAGLGGGSSDAGAALRLVREAFIPDADDTPTWRRSPPNSARTARPACSPARCSPRGRGDRLSPARRTCRPCLRCWSTRAWPVPTGPRYTAPMTTSRFSAQPTGRRPASRLHLTWLLRWSSLARRLPQRPGASGPDALRPRSPRSWPEARRSRSGGPRMARLSGSGATCFALCTHDSAQAEAAGGCGCGSQSAELVGAGLHLGRVRRKPLRACVHEPVRRRNLTSVPRVGYGLQLILALLDTKENVHGFCNA